MEVENVLRGSRRMGWRGEGRRRGRGMLRPSNRDRPGREPGGGQRRAQSMVNLRPAQSQHTNLCPQTSNRGQVPDGGPESAVDG